jgi:hypothetical protein
LTEAKALFARARDLRLHGECAEALPLFRKAYEVYPEGLGSERNIAECQETLGHFASARQAWLDLARALLTTTDRKYDGWSEDAREGAARLESEVAHLTVGVDAIHSDGTPAATDSAVVTVNGEPLPAALYGASLDRDPGRYILRVSGSSSAVQQREIDLAPGDTKRIALQIVVPSDPQQTRASSLASFQSTAPGERGRGNWTRPVAWAALSIGAASAIGAGVSLAIRQSSVSDVRNKCPQYPDGPCESGTQSSVQPAVDRGQIASTLVNVFSVVAAVGIATGVVLIVTNPGGPTHTALIFSPGGLSATGEF